MTTLYGVFSLNTYRLNLGQLIAITPSVINSLSAAMANHAWCCTTISKRCIVNALEYRKKPSYEQKQRIIYVLYARLNGHSGSLKVIYFGVSEKRMCNNFGLAAAVSKDIV